MIVYIGPGKYFQSSIQKYEQESEMKKQPKRLLFERSVSSEKISCINFFLYIVQR